MPLRYAPSGQELTNLTCSCGQLRLSLTGDRRSYWTGSWLWLCRWAQTTSPTHGIQGCMLAARGTNSFRPSCLYFSHSRGLERETLGPWKFGEDGNTLGWETGETAIGCFIVLTGILSFGLSVRQIVSCTKQAWWVICLMLFPLPLLGCSDSGFPFSPAICLLLLSPWWHRISTRP